MKVLITGGAGFIGSELGKFLLPRGHEVQLLDNLEYGYRDNFEDNPALLQTFILDDVRSPQFGEYLDGVDVVFHFAGISSLPECETKPAKAFDVNATAVANILDACRGSGVKKFIFASTSAVYENNDPSVPFEESMLVEPNLIYACTKRTAETICKAYAQNYGMDIAVCRFFNVFGPHQDFKRPHPPFTSYLIREILADRPPTIFNTSDVQRDYIFVDDLLEYLYRIMTTPKVFGGEIFNLASGKGISALNIAGVVFRSLGKELKYLHGNPDSFWDKYPSLFDKNFNLSRGRISKEVYKHSIGNNQKIVGELGFEPKTDLMAGLQSVIDYQRRL